MEGGFVPFSMGINPNVSVIARLEFELTYFDIVVQHVSHSTTGIFLFDCDLVPLILMTLCYN